MVHRVSLLQEVHLQEIWRRQAFRREGLRTESGRSLEILFSGFASAEGGPDFRSARLRFDGQGVAGDVEIHCRPSDWDHHGHNGDPAFDGVVLHVVLDRDGRELPGETLVLRPHLCRSPLSLVRGEGGDGMPPSWMPGVPGESVRFLEEAGWIRWERRRSRVDLERRRIGLPEAVHRNFFRALGYQRNRIVFQEIARRVPASEVAGLTREEIGERLRGAAQEVGFWRSRGVRPSGRVMERIEAAARLLSFGTVEQVLLPSLQFRPLARGVRIAIQELMKKGGLGRERSEIVAVHGLLPFCGTEGEVKAFLSRTPARGTNHRERETGLLLPVPPGNLTLLQKLGLLEWRDHWESSGHFFAESSHEKRERPHGIAGQESA